MFLHIQQVLTADEVAFFRQKLWAADAPWVDGARSAGGQAVHQPLLQERVRQRLAARAITDVRVLDEDPVHGAVRLARALLATGTVGSRRPRA